MMLRGHSPRSDRVVPGLLIGVALWLSLTPRPHVGPSAQASAPALREWPSVPPADCPFEKSTDITGLAFTGRHAQYTHADTWYPSWASDDKMYSPWTDGEVNGLRSRSFGDHPTTGSATIVGDDPTKLSIIDAQLHLDQFEPYAGRYPSGSLVYNGVWYYGTYCLKTTPGKGLNWDVLGPFVGFRHSTDNGKTWHDTAHTPSDPLFEPSTSGDPVKIGAPHFVDFGRNMEHSPDGKAYLVAHGATTPDAKPRDANASWITGDQVFLLRVPPSIHTMNDRTKYEYFAGRDSKGNPVWTRDFRRIKPLIEWNNNAGCVTMTYDPPLKKYLMAVTDGGTTISKFNTYILESSWITGPWKLVTYMKDFGEQGYFVNFPSKFIGRNGRTLWLWYSANFTNGTGPGRTNYRSDPPGSGYWLTTQEVELLSSTPGPVQ